MRASLVALRRRLGPAVPAVVIGGVLAFLPFPTCFVRLALGVPCPGCGVTRAMLALARLDLAASVAWHPLAIPLALLVAASVPAALTLDDRSWRRFATIASGCAGVALIVVWVLRFFGLFGGPVPA